MRALATHCAVAVVVLLGLSVSSASALERTIRWTHPNPSDVTGFTVHWGYAPGAYELEMNYEGNVADADGVFSLSLDFEPNRAIYIAVTASRDSETSVLSNERMIYEATPLGVPGRPRLADEEG